jgi:Protein of unknown function (DUF3300)
MNPDILKILRQAIALLLVYALPVATCPVAASVAPHGQQQEQWKQAPPETSSPKISNDELDSLVAPIALYPDPLLAQMLVASTYPLEVIQLQQWLDRNKGLKDKALVDAVQKQDWDASIQALAAMPDVVKILSENIKWTTGLGDAFLAQQNDVMDAVQRMRMKAKNSGQLKSSEQQKVETKVVEEKTVVVIEPSKPDVIYVPSYDPVVVYGAPVYPYPPMYYPPGYAAAGMALSFGVGVAVGAAWGGCCGWGCGWGGNNNVYINNNNNFINNQNLKNANINNQNLKNANANRGANQGGRSNWQHDPSHRGGTPYGNRDTANRYGGTTRTDSMANRQASARQNQGWQKAGMREGGPGGMDRGSRGGASTMDRGAGGFGGGGDRVGNHDVSRGSGGGAFGGASSGMSNRGAGASQARGASSMGSRSGGSFGGGAGAGARAGGGGRRR